MKLPLFRINESEDPRVAEGMARVAKIDGDIAALKKRIAELEDDKSNIQTEIAKVTGQDAQEQQDQGGQNQEQMIQQAVAAATAAVAGGTNESLVERLDPTMDEEDRINMLMDELSDEIVYYLNNDPENPRVREIKNELRDLQDELAQLEMDQMDHEDSYEDLEDPIYEGYASKFRPGKMEWSRLAVLSISHQKSHFGTIEYAGAIHQVLLLSLTDITIAGHTVDLCLIENPDISGRFNLQFAVIIVLKPALQDSPASQVNIPLLRLCKNRNGHK